MKFWNLKVETIDYVNLIITSTRLAPLLKKLSFSVYVAIWGCILGCIFFHALVLAMALRINKITSRLYQIIVSFTHYFTIPLTTFLLIPIAGSKI